MTSVDIIILTKNNHDDLLRTLGSIPKPNTTLLLKVLVIDGGDCQNILFQALSTFETYFDLVYCNSAKLGIYGIYPSMNLALDKVTSDWFIFMNSGDKFHQDFDFSIIEPLLNSSDLDVIFGQALVVSLNSIVQWLVPDPKISNIYRWLQFYEPNHQTIFVKNYISNKYSFHNSSPIGADALWKRQLILHESFIYIPIPITCFYLGGISDQYRFSILKTKFFEPSRRPFEKLMEVMKFLLSALGIMHPKLQKIRSSLIGFLF